MTPPRPRRFGPYLLALFLVSASGGVLARQAPPPGEGDGLPGRLAPPSREQIEGVLRKLRRDPVTAELVDRIDALYRPRRAAARRFEDLLERLDQPELI